MKVSDLGLVCVACTATLIQAEIFSTPIYSVARNSTYAQAKRAAAREDRIARSRTNSHKKSEVKKERARVSRRVRHNEDGQKRLKGPVGGVENDDEYLAALGKGKFLDDVRARYGSGVPEWDWNELVYVIDLEVGSPPQSSRALLSISDNDMFLPSVDCTNTCHSHQLYDPSLSNTKTWIGTLFAMDYARCSAFGNLVSDTITFAGLKISQQFGAVDSVGRFTDPDWGNLEWDGLFGLAPSSTHSPHSIPNPFINLRSQKLIQTPVFTLLLPQTPDTPGLLTFGTIDHTRYTGPLKLLPLLNHTIAPQTRSTMLPDLITDRWQIPCKSLTISGTSSSYNLRPYVAILETSYPGIGLPSSLVTSLHTYLGMEFRGYDVPPSIPCSSRDSLPVIALRLGDHEFPLTAYEYTLEVDRTDIGGHRCVSLFMEIEEEMEGDVKRIVLGSGFLRNWFGVFNLKEREVAFGKVGVVGIVEDKFEV
ncbi:putative procathepsin e protein [Botrytis fragariae]|uniref:Putative procathepsin e protein n=1 Tax=Botrytis fragariae TaxID=1964551 RepID=A0A8H6B124_9HELO|nr:putative procathepsin e protein [Botrytis fragariae]KAF5877341.1 putative procathepsin e protein [Botrytis fragariae]